MKPNQRMKSKKFRLLENNKIRIKSRWETRKIKGSKAGNSKGGMFQGVLRIIQKPLRRINNPLEKYLMIKTKTLQSIIFFPRLVSSILFLLLQISLSVIIFQINQLTLPIISIPLNLLIISMPLTLPIISMPLTLSIPLTLPITHI